MRKLIFIILLLLWSGLALSLLDDGPAKKEAVVKPNSSFKKSTEKVVHSVLDRS